MYYSYHANAKKLIREGHLVEARLTKKGNASVLLLIFDNHRPMPVKEERIAEYAELIRLKKPPSELS